MIDKLKTLAFNAFCVLFSCIAVPVGFATILFVIFNAAGLLFGFEYISPSCNALRNKTQTNLEYYFFPVATYACKKGAGLLQPAVSNAVEWLETTKK